MTEQVPNVNEARAPEIATAVTQLLVEGNYTMQEATSAIGTILTRLFISASRTPDEALMFVANFKVEVNKIIRAHWAEEKARSNKVKSMHAEQQKVQNAIDDAAKSTARSNGHAAIPSKEDPPG